MEDAVPDAHNPALGALASDMLFALPQAPLTLWTTGAAQLAVAPPFNPAHVHIHGPEPETDDAIPDEHRFSLGVLASVMPFALPQYPLTAAVEGASAAGASEDVSGPVASRAVAIESEDASGRFA
jgi:hypothetical protein